MPVVAAFAVPHPPLIVPGVGRGRERDIAATVAAYEEVARRVAEIAPDTLVISSPHTTSYLDYLHISPGRGAHGDFRDFGDRADGSDVSYDVELVRELEGAAEAAGIPARRVLSALTLLQVQGHVAEHPGKRFQALARLKTE